MSNTFSKIKVENHTGRHPTSFCVHVCAYTEAKGRDRNGVEIQMVKR